MYNIELDTITLQLLRCIELCYSTKDPPIMHLPLQKITSVMTSQTLGILTTMNLVEMSTSYASNN